MQLWRWRAVPSALSARKAPQLHVAEDVGEGPVVVLLHGIASSAATFEHVIPDLSTTHRCIAIELLGFGQSVAPPDAEYTIDEHVNAIGATLRGLRLKGQFTVVGHSLGSLLAARLAARTARRVRHLVLASPPIYLQPDEIGDPTVRRHVDAYLKAYDYLTENKSFTMAAAVHVTRLFGLGETLSITESNWNAFTLSLRNCIQSQTAISDIAEVKCPVDVVYGALDQFIAPGTLEIIARMRHVTMHRVIAADHVVRRRLAVEIVRTVRDSGLATAPVAG